MDLLCTGLDHAVPRGHESDDETQEVPPPEDDYPFVGPVRDGVDRIRIGRFDERSGKVTILISVLVIQLNTYFFWQLSE